jgi:hypothetical protein
MDHTAGHKHGQYPVTFNNQQMQLLIESSGDSNTYTLTAYDVTNARRRLLSVVFSDPYMVKHLYFSNARSARDCRLGAALGDAENIWHDIRDIEVSANGTPTKIRLHTDANVDRFQLQIFVGQTRLVNIVSQDTRLIQHFMFSEGRSVRDVIISGII